MTHRLMQDAQNRRHADKVGFLQRPGSLTVDIGVAGTDELPHLFQRLGHGKACQLAAHQFREKRRIGQQGIIVLAQRIERRQGGIAIACDQAQCALRQIAQIIRQLDIQAIDQRAAAEIGIPTERYLTQQEEAHGVETEALHEITRSITLPIDLLIFSPSIVHQPLA